jgi:hypothetical protein
VLRAWFEIRVRRRADEGGLLGFSRESFLIFRKPPLRFARLGAQQTAVH